MHLSEFLHLILPTTGIKYLALQKTRRTDGRSTYHHHRFDTIDALATAAVGYDRQGEHVYMALAGFDAPIQVGDKVKRRTQAQALAAKAFWLDIDCGEDKAAEGKGYATKQDAIVALVEFCKTVRLPAPMIVDSGGGLHCYWPLDRELPNHVWVTFASWLRAAINFTGLLADRARDTDMASVLRPPYTHNRKPGREPVQVKVLRPVDKPFPARGICQRLVEFAQANPVVETLRPTKTEPVAAAAGPSINSDLAVEQEFENGSFRKAAKRCAQLQRWIDTADNLQEPDWRNMLATTKFSSEGEDLGHHLSSQDDRYTESETQEKLDLYRASAPPSCATIAEYYPEICAACKMRGKVPNPMILGMPEREDVNVFTVEEPAPATTPAPATETPGLAVADAPTVATTITLPKGYGTCHKTGAMFMLYEDEEGTQQRRYLTDRKFWIEDHVWDSHAGNYYTTWKVRHPKGRIDSFTLKPGEHASQGIKERLAGMKIMIMGNALESVRRYMADSISDLERRKDEIVAASQFGWDSTQESFVFGKHVYKAGNKSVGKLSAAAEQLADNMGEPKGSARLWGQALETLYADPKRAPLLYAACSAVGCVMSPLVQEQQYHGLVLALTSTASGMGKTTAGEVGFMAFGDPSNITLRTSRGDTVMFRKQRLGLLNNLPIVFDEWSDMTAEDLFHLTYDIAGGSDRGRLGSNGTADQRQTWATSPILTANNNMSDLLRTIKGGAEAQAVRMLEFRLDDLGIEPGDHTVADRMVAQARDNAGAAGELVIADMTKDPEAVRQRLALWVELITTHAPVLKAPEYRFYRSHMACTFEAAETLNRLGIANLDVDALVATICRTVAEIAGQITTDYTFDVSTVVADMLTAAAPNTYVTAGMPVDGRNRAFISRDVRGGHAAVGRYVAPDPNTPAIVHDTYLLSETFMRTWCAENRHDYRRVIGACQAAGLLLDLNPVYGRRKLTLTHAMADVPRSNDSRLVCIDFAKLTGQPVPRIAPAADDTSGMDDYPEAQA